ncbi:MAG: hypothetical protein VXW22_07875, partial [Pseudomonadota bacterium]|nr:hypothetical protein [Pseudomonadota bacterium]
MIKQFLISSAAGFALAACGQSVTADTPAPEDIALVEAQSDTSGSTEPQVGDRIPEPSADLEDSNRLA